MTRNMCQIQAMDLLSTVHLTLGGVKFVLVLAVLITWMPNLIRISVHIRYGPPHFCTNSTNPYTVSEVMQLCERQLCERMNALSCRGKTPGMGQRDTIFAHSATKVVAAETRNIYLMICLQLRIWGFSWNQGPLKILCIHYSY